MAIDANRSRRPGCASKIAKIPPSLIFPAFCQASIDFQIASITPHHFESHPLIRRRLAKNIAGLAETDPAKGHRYSRAFKQQMEMDGLYDRTTKSDVMKSTFTAVLWFYDDEKLEERRREILEEIRRNMTPGQRARFNSPISAQ